MFPWIKVTGKGRHKQKPGMFAWMSRNISLHRVRSPRGLSSSDLGISFLVHSKLCSVESMCIIWYLANQYFLCPLWQRHEDPQTTSLCCCGAKRLVKPGLPCFCMWEKCYSVQCPWAVCFLMTLACKSCIMVVTSWKYWSQGIIKNFYCPCRGSKCPMLDKDQTSFL